MSVSNRESETSLAIGTKLAGVLLAVYAVALTIKGTATLQAALLLTAAALLVAERWKKYDFARREALQVAWPLLVFSCWVLLTCPLWRDLPKESVSQPGFGLNQWRRDILQPMLALLCGYWAFRHEASKRALYRVLAVWVGVLTAVAVHQYFIGREVVVMVEGYCVVDWYKGTLHMNGFSRDNIFFSYVLYLLTPGLAWLMLRGRTRKDRMLAIVALVLLGLLILMGKRRGTWLAVGFEIFLILLWTNRRWFFAFIVIILLLGAGAYHVRPLWFKRDYDTKSKEGRVQIMSKVPELVLEHPWVGVGFGKDTVVKNYWSRIYQHAHNTFANMALSSGLPGAALWIAALAVYAQRFRRSTRSDSDWTARIGLAFLLGFCLRNFVDDVWISSVAELFWLQMGVFLPSVTERVK